MRQKRQPNQHIVRVSIAPQQWHCQEQTKGIKRLAIWVSTRHLRDEEDPVDVEIVKDQRRVPLVDPVNQNESTNKTLLSHAAVAGDPLYVVLDADLGGFRALERHKRPFWVCVAAIGRFCANAGDNFYQAAKEGLEDADP